MIDFEPSLSLDLTNSELRSITKAILNASMGEDNKLWEKYLILNTFLINITSQIIEKLLTEVDKNLTIVQRPLKSNQTLIAKIEGLKGPLTSVQDLAGVRIVKDMTLTEQDELVSNIINLLGDSFHHHKDRRLEPSEGYRAVHIIAKFDKIFVEIQVRTKSQHEWADAFEQLADVIGRQIRYGEKPNGLSSEQVNSRVRLIQAMKEWSLIHIAGIEDAIDQSASPDEILRLREASFEHIKSMTRLMAL